MNDAYMPVSDPTAEMVAQLNAVLAERELVARHYPHELIDEVPTAVLEEMAGARQVVKSWNGGDTGVAALTEPDLGDAGPARIDALGRRDAAIAVTELYRRYVDPASVRADSTTP